MFDPVNWQQIRPDYIDAIQAGFNSAPSAPTEPPQQWTVLDFLLPGALPGNAARWAGRFGADGPEAILALDGEQAVYAWKDANSRGYAEGKVTHRGDALLIELRPGLSLLLDPLPDNAFQATYEQRGQPSVTRLDWVGQQ